MVCPSANLTPTIVLQINRNRQNANASSVPKGTDWKPIKLSKKEERREIRNCAITVVVFAIICILIEYFIH